MTHPHHSIDYVEISVTDVAQAQAFYGAAFGWSFNDYGPDYAGIVAADGDGEAGGLARGDTQGGHPLVLMVSEDLEASERAVLEAGGEVVDGPFDYPGGRRFHFRDPSGNVLGVFQPGH
jgi:uncharacterized protein